MIKQQTKDFPLGYRWNDKLLSGRDSRGWWAGYRGSCYQAYGKTRKIAIAKVRELIANDCKKAVERMLEDNGVDLTHRIMEWDSKT